MCWVGIFNKKIFATHWFVDSNNRPFNQVTVNQEVYLKMLEEWPLPKLKSERYYRRMWFQQNVAPSYTGEIVVDYLRNAFGDRIVSRSG